MKKLASGALLASFLFGIAVPAWADNAWVGYTGVDRSKPQHRPPSRPHYAPQPLIRSGLILRNVRPMAAIILLRRAKAGSISSIRHRPRFTRIPIAIAGSMVIRM